MQDARDRDVVDAKDPVDGHVMAGSGSQQMAYLLRSEPITLLQLMMRPKSSLDWCFLAQCLNGAVEVPVPARGEKSRPVPARGRCHDGTQHIQYLWIRIFFTNSLVFDSDLVLDPILNIISLS